MPSVFNTQCVCVGGGWQYKVGHANKRDIGFINHFTSTSGASSRRNPELFGSLHLFDFEMRWPSIRGTKPLYPRRAADLIFRSHPGLDQITLKWWWTPFIPLALDITWGNKTHRHTQTELMQQSSRLSLFLGGCVGTVLDDWFIQPQCQRNITTVTTAALFTRWQVARRRISQHSQRKRNKKWKRKWKVAAMVDQHLFFTTV